MKSSALPSRSRRFNLIPWMCCVIAVPVGAVYLVNEFRSPSEEATDAEAELVPNALYPRRPMDTSGFSVLVPSLPPWTANATLPEIRDAWDRLGYRAIARLDELQEISKEYDAAEVSNQLTRAVCLMYEGEADRAYRELLDVRLQVVPRPDLARNWLSCLMYFQGVAALRRGENDNCIMCRGESSCILPISQAAVHKNPEGSRLAIGHFTEYLQVFPDDLEVQWLLNVAHMTLGEFPDGVDPRFRLDLRPYLEPEFDIGRFRDVGHVVGVNRFNQAGGALMEDFDNDGWLDLAVSSFDAGQVIGLYRNKGDGEFEELAVSAGLGDQLGGLTCAQTDYNNDGLMDIYVPRGAWLNSPIRPSLLRNDGGWHFTDVTEETGLLDPVNSNAGIWADYDNDGWLDLFVCCERQAHRLYHNLGNGTFAEVAQQAGVAETGQKMGKGSAWIDFDNDNYPDLFVNSLGGTGQLFHNDRNGTFSNVTYAMGINGPETGFSCWAWDFDNDGWMDIFATCYERTLGGVVRGLMGQPHGMHSNRLFRNIGGTQFLDVTREAGMDVMLATMGSNYGDFDNDGYLDMYLGTGEPALSTLIPNRMFKNVDGKRFAEITTSAGVGHLQKGHGVACGDWNRDGSIDIFLEVGGAIPGDRFHNVLFQNPGHDNRWLSVKLVGRKTNRAAIGARIKIVTAGDTPQTIYRHVSQGSSFGSSPLEQTIGIGMADRIALLEIHWPTSDTTQSFHDVAVNQMLEITEFADSYQKREIAPIALSN